MPIVQRALARAMFPEWASKGWSAARMIRGLKTLKIPTYRRSIMLADIRVSMDTIKFTPKVLGLKANVRVPKSAMVETELRKDAKYRIFARSKERDIETGRVSYPHKSIYTNKLGSKDEYADDFIEIAEKGGAGTYKVVEEIQIIGIQHFKGRTY